jgi:ribose/xylose/arabinose/galactoside ABC-type transport system permease subunit
VFVFVAAIVIGAVNGWLVVERHVPPFVATFGMLVLLEGARLAYRSGTVSGTDFSRGPVADSDPRDPRDRADLVRASHDARPSPGCH